MANLAENSEAALRIAQAYDPNVFQACGQRLVDQLASHLREVTQSQKNVLNWNTPQDNVDFARSIMSDARHESNENAENLPTDGSVDADVIATRAVALADVILKRQHNLHDPRYIGHQVPPPVPVAALFEAISAISNQGMAVYEMGPWATAVEAVMVERLGEKIGFDPGAFAGLVTSGGSLANLTALLTARNVALRKETGSAKRDPWNDGMAGGASLSPVIVTHEEVHYSIVRAAGVLGIGAGNVVRCKVDDRHRMDAHDLDQKLKKLKTEGRPVVAVVAAACSTRTGAFDPLDAIADVCAAHDVWMHVDAAHGGAACCSERYRHRVAGLQRADSVILDAHKMLHAPALCTFAFYKNKTHRFAAFAQDASYLFGEDIAPEYESGLATIECTKRAAVYGLWGTWMLFGEQLFSDVIDTTFDLTHHFHTMLRDADDFEPLHEPQCNIQVFRHVPASLRGATMKEVGAFQLEVRKRLVRSGQFYIVTCKDNGVPALRVTVINPLTTRDTVQSLLDAIRETGKAVVSE